MFHAAGGHLDFLDVSSTNIAAAAAQAEYPVATNLTPSGIVMEDSLLTCTFNATSPVNCTCGSGFYMDSTSCEYSRCVGGVTAPLGCPEGTHVDTTNCSAAPAVSCAPNSATSCEFHCAFSLCGPAVEPALHRFDTGRAHLASDIIPAFYDVQSLNLTWRGITSVADKAFQCWCVSIDPVAHVRSIFVSGS